MEDAVQPSNVSQIVSVNTNMAVDGRRDDTSQKILNTSTLLETSENLNSFENGKVNGDLSSPVINADVCDSSSRDAMVPMVSPPKCDISPNDFGGSNLLKGQCNQAYTLAKVPEQVASGLEAKRQPTEETSKPKVKKRKLRRILPSKRDFSSPEFIPTGTLSESLSPGSSLTCTEYAQCLGLQPTVKFKCYKCGGTGFPSIGKLKEHQNICLKSTTTGQTPRANTPEPNSGSGSAATQNLRITRKVFLCSACGTYFENWKLYIHMIEVHRRHVCLACLSMFTHAEKLALHMSTSHNTTLEAFSSAEDFLFTQANGSFLTCCTCERIFSEQENFFDHECGDKVGKEQGCAMCGLQFAHMPNCPHSDAAGCCQEAVDHSRSQSTASGPAESGCYVHQPEQLKDCSPGSSAEATLTKPPEKPPLKQPWTKGRLKTIDMLEQEDSQSTANTYEDGFPPVPNNLGKIKPKLPGIRIRLAPIRKRAANKKNSPMEWKLKSPPKQTSEEETDSQMDLDILREELKNLDTLSNSVNTELLNGELSPLPSPQISPTIPEKRPEDHHNMLESMVESMEEAVPEARNDEHKKHEVKALIPEIKNEGLDSGDDVDQSDDESEKLRPYIHEDEEKSNENEDKEIDQTESNQSCEKLDRVRSSEKMNGSRLDDHMDCNSSENEDGCSRSDKERADSRSGSVIEVDQSGSDMDGNPSENDIDGSRSDGENDGNRSSEPVYGHQSDDQEDESMSEHEEHNKMKGQLDDEEEEYLNESNEELTIDDPTSNLQTNDQSPASSPIPSPAPSLVPSPAQSLVESLASSPVPSPAPSLVPSLVLSQANENEADEEEELLLAGEDTPVMEILLETLPEELPIQSVLKLAIQEACTTCVYCTHANKIAVNGKQLAIHLVSEHRYQLTVDSKQLPSERFVELVKGKMQELEEAFFNCDTYDNSVKAENSTFVKSYECFQCRFVTGIHKELYLHNRKMHQKSSLVCIMCKSNFYSYSELLCHICPGIYRVTNQPLFRCCFCSIDDLPSAFRLMVHVRKRHNSCDVCLEHTGDQQKLSNHVWKHKLHHFCYRCGIAYRNKPDITKHLFWKHGTESVLCKKCLQKKWPYVYHFCIPPSSFSCEECNSTFSRAVALKVHKRLHSNELLYPCDICGESFISRKLLVRHDITIHNPPPPEEKPEPPPTPKENTDEINKKSDISSSGCESQKEINVEVEKEKPSPGVPHPVVENTAEPTASEKKIPKVVDVYDLPPLNLSSESEDESDSETKSTNTAVKPTSGTLEDVTINSTSNDGVINNENLSKDYNAPKQFADSVWDSFQDYRASSSKDTSISYTDQPSTSSDPSSKVSQSQILERIFSDHDYFSAPTTTKSSPSSISKADVPVEDQASGELNSSFDVDHNYCSSTVNPPKEEAPEVESTPKKKQKSPKKKKKSTGSGSSSSDSDSSSSGSDSSSCSCGTNCSCSSSSSSSSGSSSSDSSDSDSSSSEKRAKKARKKERACSKKQSKHSPTTNGHVDVPLEEPNVEDVGTDPPPPPVLYFHESDLYTSESETDEDFYDKQPRILVPTRNISLLNPALDSILSPQSTPVPTPPPFVPVAEEPTYPLNGLPAQSYPEQTETLINIIPKKQSKKKKLKRSLSSPRRENRLKISNIRSNQMKSEITRTPVQKKRKAPMTWTYKPPGNDSQILTPPSTTTSPAFPQTPIAPFYTDSAYSPGSPDFKGSGSETDLRLSKRKRVPKKFYGDSSEEEAAAAAANAVPGLIIRQPKKKPRTMSISEAEVTRSKPQSEADRRLQATLDFVAAGLDGRTAEEDSNRSFGNRRVTIPQISSPAPPPPVIPTVVVPILPPVSLQDLEGNEDSSSDESEEESEDERPANVVGVAGQPSDSYSQRPMVPNRQEPVKLYCYCQCPYDEVSEMIACDGMSCAIEWFHFECVGITVPPKGKWYCPDCRRRYKIPESPPNSDYIYNANTEYRISSHSTLTET